MMGLGSYIVLILWCVFAYRFFKKIISTQIEKWKAKHPKKATPWFIDEETGEASRALKIAFFGVNIALIVGAWGLYQYQQIQRDELHQRYLQLQEANAESSKAEDTSEDDTTTQDETSDQDETSSTGAEQISEEPPENIAEIIPYDGMPEDWISLTYIGEYDEVKSYNLRVRPANEYVPGKGYRNVDTTMYTWRSKNGADERIFTAYCWQGIVIQVTKWMTKTTYWPDGIQGLPDLSADGASTAREFEATESNRPDPFDYDNGEEYADDAQWWYEKRGYANPWLEALDYYDTEGPAEDITDY